MTGTEFVDYYELLQVSPNADAETIERIFRHLAQKYHPDHNESSNKDRFLLILEAYQVLSSPEQRAGYDVRYQDHWERKWRLTSAVGELSDLGDDKLTRERLLSLLYVQRRRNMQDPGLGQLEISRLLNVPQELVEFHLWYIRNKGWVERLETGHLAITALGVDEAEKSRLLSPDYLLEASSHVEENTEAKGDDHSNIRDHRKDKVTD